MILRKAVDEFFDFALDQSLDAGLAQSKVPQIAQREAANILPSLAFAEHNTCRNEFDEQTKKNDQIVTLLMKNK